MKQVALVLFAVLSGCGVGSDPVVSEAKTMSVRLSFDAVPPSPFVLGPSGTQATPASTPVVTFVTGPVVGPTAIVTPPIVVVGPTLSTVNWCTDGFVIGPCVQRCEPNQFVTGPCP